MDWVRAVSALREERRAGVLVTVASVRGHAPREPGAKMVVAADAVWGTVGGGNLEASALARVREMLADQAAPSAGPELMTMTLSERAPARYGAQCCGGEATLLLEPLPVVPAVAIFGVGHVGLELARVLARQDLDLHLVDSRAGLLDPARLHVLDDARARVRVHEVPVLPELVLADLPLGVHVLVMTHDHGEDAALCDAALRVPGVAWIGLIGSAAKWSRFRRRLAEVGHAAEALDRVVSPIGLASLRSKEPATIAVSVAAALLESFDRQASGATATAAATTPDR